MSLIEQFNVFLSPGYADTAWRIVEGMGAAIMAISTILQRIYIPSYTQSHGGNRFFRIVGQLGIGFQALLSLFMIADAFDFSNNPHVFLTMFMLASLFAKGKMFLTLYKVLNPYQPIPDFDTSIEA